MPDLSDTQPRPFWSQDWEALQEPLTKLRRSIASLPTSPLRVMRVSQLDADLLDVELFGVLKDQLWQALSFFRPTFKETFEPEFVIILQLILYRLSIYESGASYGKQLQNLNYRNERGHRGGLESIAIDSTLTRFQRIMYGAITVGGQYAWTRLNRLVTAQGWGDLGEAGVSSIYCHFELLITRMMLICRCGGNLDTDESAKDFLEFDATRRRLVQDVVVAQFLGISL
ncbi:hypothetical protein BC936DRAFT_139293 [Jimgerdemannia flammicorona]|uniref:RING-type E3 ubiquitin transferase (cysteine targeting) n=1 Tax=Jimgerdemannia flammicorona TaxID=994334 RepID=A0A433BA69_9FUNG|nr:hypothetical protein BC936DRAFT_139293 [Jimgerdemannia flammicorona]